MPPTPEQAKAELERRKDRKLAKQKGETLPPVNSHEIGEAFSLSKPELVAIAESK